MITPGKRRAWKNPIAFGLESGLLIKGSSDDSMKTKRVFHQILHFISQNGWLPSGSACSLASSESVSSRPTNKQRFKFKINIKKA
jgi:hypothetical protein